MARIISRRATQVLLVLLALVCLGTVAFLSAVNAYFSIDKSAIILAEELGTWEQISFAGDRPSLALKSRYPQLSEALKSKPNVTTKMTKEEELLFNEAVANAKHAAEAAKKAGFSNDDGIFIPPVRDNSVKAWNATTDPPEKIPRIIHQTWKDKILPSNWQEVRDECAQMHPD
jgi:mannosyltransferase OCH1-like enzyme